MHQYLNLSDDFYHLRQQLVLLTQRKLRIHSVYISSNESGLLLR